MAKVRIAVNNEYILSGERYKKNTPQSSLYTWSKIGTLIETISPPAKIQKTAFAETGKYPIIDQSKKEIAGWTNDESTLIQTSKPLVIFGDHTCTVKLIETPFAQGADGIKILSTIDTVNPRFLYHVLRVMPLENNGYQRHFSKLKDYEIPLPPLEVQREIVAEIDGYQKVIDGARAVVENYRPHITIDPDWPTKELSEVAYRITDGTHKTPHYTDSGIPFLRVTDITKSNESKKFISEKEHMELIQRCHPQKGDVLYTKNGTIGVAKVVDWEGDFSIFVSLALIKPRRELVDSYFLEYFLNSDPAYKQASSRSKSGTVTNLHLVDIKTIKIPLPPLNKQQQIVTEIEAEQALVKANRELIERMDTKIRNTINRVWGKTEA